MCAAINSDMTKLCSLQHIHSLLFTYNKVVSSELSTRECFLMKRYDAETRVRLSDEIIHTPASSVSINTV